ncbi:hypothetical protein [Bradyrhizobium liaoningense]
MTIGTCANPLPSRGAEYFRACQSGHRGSEKTEQEEAQAET